MPNFGRITFSTHALERMRKRGITRSDVMLALEHGDAAIDEDEFWYIDFSTIRIVLVETSDDTGHIVTVIRLRNHA